MPNPNFCGHASIFTMEEATGYIEAIDQEMKPEDGVCMECFTILDGFFRDSLISLIKKDQTIIKSFRIYEPEISTEKESYAPRNVSEGNCIKNTYTPIKELARTEGGEGEKGGRKARSRSRAPRSKTARAR